ncbi:MAG: transcriptional regulator [Akkermansiaceae bacterium]|nr:transcriptional regulator [Akkermansiaceae bacterium]
MVSAMKMKCSTSDCPVDFALGMFGGKWKGSILYLLLNGTMRFNELKRMLFDVTQRMLTRQLRELEQSGLVHRHVYAQVPPKVEYSLTEAGESLRPLLMDLAVWGRKHTPASEIPPAG